MDSGDRAAIEELFRKLADVEQRAAPRDPEAEAFIRSEIARQPGAPYYMAQTIVVQEQALNEAQRRIEELEGELQGGQAGGGLLGGLFGSGGQAGYGRAARRPTYEPWGPARGGGGGFLAGAAQTAMGVAGGILLGNMLGGMFAGDEAEAADHGEVDQVEADHGDVGADAGGDFGGDF